VLAACDPANPYGAALPWPAQGPSRAAGALVVLIDGLCVAHLTRGGKTLTTFFEHLPEGIDHQQTLESIYRALLALISAGRLSPLVIERAICPSIFDACLSYHLLCFGFLVFFRVIRLATTAAVPRTPPQSHNEPRYDPVVITASSLVHEDRTGPRRCRI